MKGLDFACGRDVRPPAEIGEGAVCVKRHLVHAEIADKFDLVLFSLLVEEIKASCALNSFRSKGRLALTISSILSRILARSSSRKGRS